MTDLVQSLLSSGDSTIWNHTEILSIFQFKKTNNNNLSVRMLCSITVQDQRRGKVLCVARSEVSAGQILKLYSWILLHFWQRPDRFFLNWMEQQASYIVSPSLMMKICDHNCSDDAGFLQRLCCVTLGKIIEESLLW